MNKIFLYLYFVKNYQENFRAFTFITIITALGNAHFIKVTKN